MTLRLISPYVNQDKTHIAEKLSLHVRKKMYAEIMSFFKPSINHSVLDVGVTCDNRTDSNFFEKLYPYLSNLVAVGLEEASFLERDFPGLKYVKADGMHLPFPDKSFDFVVSFAVLEHVGAREMQKKFLGELLRVGKQVCITTPNRWYPVEFHTFLPLLHWLPARIFRKILEIFGQNFFSKEENLNLLTNKEFYYLLPDGIQVRPKHMRLFGLVSNLMFFLKDSEIEEKLNSES